MKKLILFTIILGLLSTTVSCSQTNEKELAQSGENAASSDMGTKEAPEKNVTPDVTIDDIELTDLKVNKGEDNGNYISATVTNNSKYKLSEVGFAYQSKNSEDSVGAIFSIPELESGSTSNVTGENAIADDNSNDLMLMAMTYEIIYDDGKIINVSYSVSDDTYEVFTK